MKKKTLVILTMQNNTTIASKAHLVSKLFSNCAQFFRTPQSKHPVLLYGAFRGTVWDFCFWAVWAEKRGADYEQNLKN